ncbi:MAG: AAA family ATPase [Candidatus Baldrarchaeia archaeon]
MASKGDSPMRREIDVMVKEIKERFGIVGREKELRMALAAKLSGRHLLLEGDVGVGKTLLASAIAQYFGQPMYRVDGDERYTESKLVGYWDPPLVIAYGYDYEKSFIPGPLTRAMLEGGILFINELNRLPESTQNVLLPAMDERKITIPKIGIIEAKNGFFIIATQNPREYVGVSALSEALRDRFVWIKLDYQSEEEEREIVRLRTGCTDPTIVEIAVKICRATREHPHIRRGASVRGAIDLVSILQKFGSYETEDWINAALMALGTKIEIDESNERSVEDIISEIVVSILENF